MADLVGIQVFHLEVRLKYPGLLRRPMVARCHGGSDLFNILRVAIVRLRHQHVRAPRQPLDCLTRPRVAREHDHAVERLDAIRERLELPASLRRHQCVMRVLRGDDANFIVLEDDAVPIKLVSHERTLVIQCRSRSDTAGRRQ